MPNKNKIERAVDAFLRDKGKGEAGESGNYRSDAERELRRFIEWLRTDTAEQNTHPTGAGREQEAATVPSPMFDTLDERTFRRYARYLVSKGYAKGTTITYYAYIASFCGWAVNEGYLSRHYANTSVARAPLPNDDGRRPGDQQAWTAEQRDRLTRYTDRTVDRILDARAEDDENGVGRDTDAVRACRDRAIAYILAYTAVRASEVFVDPDDERRNGLQWTEVNLEDGSITVFRKKQEWDNAPLPEPVIHPLSIYKQILDPPDDEWPVFPTLHRPTLSELIHDEFSNEASVAAARESHGRDIFVCREHEITPPSLLSNAARHVMERLCEGAEIDVNDDRHTYLAPHGGRRGLGEVLVRQFGYSEAARYLDTSEQIVRKHYSHIESGEQADRATEALAESDARVQSENTSDDTLS